MSDDGCCPNCNSAFSRVIDRRELMVTVRADGGKRKEKIIHERRVCEHCGRKFFMKKAKP